MTQLTFKLNYYPAVPDLVHGQRGTDLLIKISTTCEGQTEGKPELCTQTIVHLIYRTRAIITRSRLETALEY